MEPRGEGLGEAPVCPDGERDAVLRVWVPLDEAQVSALQGEGRDEAPVCPDGEQDAVLRVWDSRDGAQVSALRASVRPAWEQDDAPGREAARLPLRKAAGKPPCRR